MASKNLKIKAFKPPPLSSISFYFKELLRTGSKLIKPFFKILTVDLKINLSILIILVAPFVTWNLNICCLFMQNVVWIPRMLSVYPECCLNTQTVVCISRLVSEYPECCLNIQNVVWIPRILSVYPECCLYIQNVVWISRMLSEYPECCLYIQNVVCISYMSRVAVMMARSIIFLLCDLENRSAEPDSRNSTTALFCSLQINIIK